MRTLVNKYAFVILSCYYNISLKGEQRELFTLVSYAHFEVSSILHGMCAIPLSVSE